MPTYEYECKSCSHNFEIFQSMSDPPLKNCPECGMEVRRLIFGGTGVIFKGSGFYVTDRNKSNAKSSRKETGGTETDSSSKKADSKPETVTENSSSAAAPSPCSGCPARGVSADSSASCHA
ncbi:MAG: zinc ribbon domain-containing protein [Treponema sp.]|jgi:putative FmdB family regulatory protein|nr:zinc ribbon domain-containing protein [Treponema sp.]